MTQQQIDYWKLQESKRANQATEAENAMYHRNSEKLQGQVNAENERHNRATEAINRSNLDVAARNAATNALNAETNRRLADLTASRDVETARHNASLESIQSSYNTALMQYNEKKLNTEYEMAGLQRASNEAIAAANRENTLGIAQMEDATKRYTTNLNTGEKAGEFVIGKTLGALGGAAVIGTAAKSATKLSSEVALGAGATKAASTAAAAGGSTLLGPAIMGAGIIGSMIMAYKDTPYPFSTNIDVEDEKKGVQWYGAQ